MQAKSAVYSVLGLTRDPFPPTPDAGSYFFTEQLQDQFVEIRQCVLARKGFILVTGEVGLGKSTLVRRLLDALPSNEVISALVFNTFLQEEDLLSAMLCDYGVASTGQLASDFAALNTFLMNQHRSGKTCLLVIDDAQNLSAKSLELVRLLCNLETDQEKLLQILLVGQPELADTISSHALRQLRSRVVQHAQLRGLTPKEAVRYIEFRIIAAGGEGRISLATPAASQLHQLTRGNIRLMHLILDRCLYGLVAKQQTTIDKSLLMAAAKEVLLVSKPRFSKGLRYGLAGTLIGLTSLGGMVLVQANQAPQLLGQTSLVSNSTAAAQLSNPSLKQAVITPSTLATPSPQTGQLPTAQHQAAMKNGQNVTQNCSPLAGQLEEGRAFLTQQMPQIVMKRFRSSTAICIASNDSQTWVTWRVDPAVLQARTFGRGEAIRRAQQNLARLGWLQASQVDGFNGPQSRLAIKFFQQSIAIAPTGEIDDVTYMLLENLHAI